MCHRWPSIWLLKISKHLDKFEKYDDNNNNISNNSNGNDNDHDDNDNNNNNNDDYFPEYYLAKPTATDRSQYHQWHVNEFYNCTHYIYT